MKQLQIYNRKCLGLVLIFSFTFLIFNYLYASFGRSGWIIFRKAQSSKFKGLTTVGAIRGDLSGVFYNPAVLGTNNQREIFFISELGFAEDKFGGFVYGEPLKNGMISGGIVYYDAGKIELNWLEDGELKTNEEIIAQRDLLGILSYGHKFSDDLFSGASLKLATSKIIERESAFAYAGDLGIFYLPLKNFSVSAAAQNLGSSTKFIDDKNSLPTSAYLGSGYLYYLSPVVYCLSGAGATYNFTDKKLIPEIGFEFGCDFVSINVGYRFNIDEANLHFGLGVTYKNIDFGYAYIPGIYLNTTHRVSIGYRFGSSIETNLAQVKEIVPTAEVIISPEEKKEKMRELFVAGQEDFKQENYEPAIEKFQQVVKLEPSHQLSKTNIARAKTKLRDKNILIIENYHKQADKFISVKKYKDAVRTYQEAIKRFPYEKKFYQKLATIHMKQNQTGFVIDTYLACLEKNPDANDMRKNLAYAYEEMEKKAKFSYGKYLKKAKLHWEKLLGTEYDSLAKQHLEKRY
ncbi:MAG: hypothetical protein AB1349_09375 [Elusimicrobiota bacterium]